MSVEWTQVPQADEKLPYLKMLRVAANARPTGFITCEEIVGVKTHYHQGRTQPCTGVLCDGCDAKRATRFEAYIAVQLEPTKEHVIFALTEAAAQQLQTVQKTCGRIRGLAIALKRMGSKANGRLVVEAGLPKEPPETLPAAPPLRSLLLKIWRIPEPTEEAPIPPHIKAAKTMLRNHEQRADAD